MRTSIDILNYFRRKKQQKETAKLKRQLRKEQRRTAYFKTECVILGRKLDAQKPYKVMYNDLINVLNNISKHCALRPAAKVRALRPLREIDIFNSIHDRSEVFMSHRENLYYAEILIQDYNIDKCIHFDLDTGNGLYRYQYSKEGLAIQTPTRILKEVTQLMASAWYNKIHS